MRTMIHNPAILTVFYAQPEILTSLIDSGKFKQSLLKDTKALCKPFPIWRISQCWEVISSMTGWREEIRSKVEDFHGRNSEIIKIFKERLNVQFTTIDYQLYHDDFYCDNPEESVKDQLLVDSEQELLDAGVRQIDIDLYRAGAKFFYEEVKQLLIAGANPAAWLPDPFPSGFQLDDRVDAECSFLSTEIASYLYTQKTNEPLYRTDIGHLVGWAAYETMYALIERYRLFPHWEPQES